MRLKKFNEHSLWQKDIREINDILNIARDDHDIDIIDVESKIGVDIPEYKFSLIRTKEVFTNDKKSKVSWSGDNCVLKDTPRYDFCNKAQEIVDRLRALGHTTRVSLSFWTTDVKDEKNDIEWVNSAEISNPIDFAYHTNIYIIWINIKISDFKESKKEEDPKPNVKKWWHFGK